MKYTRTALLSAICAFLLALTACEDGKSYAELLNDESLYVNNFLADNQVILDIPADTVFITGEDAPYYRLNEDGTLYMQVLDPGTKGNRVEDDEQIYFRYTRYPLAAYKDGKLPSGEGNNISLAPAWFRYKNYQLQTTYEWGVGVQTPLDYLPVDCMVNIVIKSQMGMTNEISNVQPYLWRITYERKK